MTTGEILDVPIPQNDPRWLRARVGLLTASRAYEMCSRLKGRAMSKAAIDLALEKASERMTGFSLPHYVNADMDRGLTLEPEAVEHAEENLGIIAVEAGLFVRQVDDETGMLFGASPDRLVGDDGLLEVKCPRATTQLRRLNEGIPDEYIMQMQMQMLVTGKNWCIFYSYCPDAPERFHAYYDVVKADEKIHAQLIRCGNEIEKLIGEFELKIAEKEKASARHASELARILEK